MLILTRHVNEKIIFHGKDGIIAEVGILGIKEGQVRISIEASPDVVIDREEIYLKKLQEIKELK